MTDVVQGGATLLASGRLTFACRDEADAAHDDPRYPNRSRLYQIESFGLSWQQRCPVGSLFVLRNGGAENQGWLVRYVAPWPEHREGRRPGVLALFGGRTSAPQDGDAFEVFDNDSSHVAQILQHADRLFDMLKGDPK